MPKKKRANTAKWGGQKKSSSKLQDVVSAEFLIAIESSNLSTGQLTADTLIITIDTLGRVL